MHILPQIVGYADALSAIRLDIHAHPETGFDEVCETARQLTLCRRLTLTRQVSGHIKFREIACS